MANIKSFPNNQDTYIGAEDVMKWLHGRTSGVFGAGNNAAVAPLTDASMAVSVSDGKGWITNSEGDGVVWWNDNEKENGTKLQLTVSAADGTLNRIDRVIVEWTTTNYVAYPEIKILKGTASSTASAPALTNTSIKRQISLARISIPAGTTKITSSLITDERLDNSVCGIVTESVTADTSVINAQFNELLDTLRENIQQVTDGQIADGSITADKLATGAICNGSASFSLAKADWVLNSYGVYEQTKTLDGRGFKPDKHVGFLGHTRGLAHYPGDGSTSWSWSTTVMEQDEEKLACLYSASLVAEDTVKFVAKEIPNGTLYVTILFFQR